MSFAKYSAYKEGGVAWLGEVPEHWEVDGLFLRMLVIPLFLPPLAPILEA